MDIREVQINGDILSQLIDMSVDWEREGVCYGYQRNGPADIEGNRVFLAYEGEKIGQGRENAKLYLAEHPDVMQEIEQKVREKHGLVEASERAGENVDTPQDAE